MSTRIHAHIQRNPLAGHSPGCSTRSTSTSDFHRLLFSYYFLRNEEAVNELNSLLMVTELTLVDLGEDLSDCVDALRVGLGLFACGGGVDRELRSIEAVGGPSSSDVEVNVSSERLSPKRAEEPSSSIGFKAACNRIFGSEQSGASWSVYDVQVVYEHTRSQPYD